jgi:hypothetical protein
MFIVQRSKKIRLKPQRGGMELPGAAHVSRLGLAAGRGGYVLAQQAGVANEHRARQGGFGCLGGGHRSSLGMSPPPLK